MKHLHPGQRLHSVFHILFFLFVFLFLLTVWVQSPVYKQFRDINQSVVQEPDVIWRSDSGAFETDELPARFPCDEQGTARIRATLPEDTAFFNSVLMLRLSQESIRVWLDGELLLEQGTEKLTGFLGKSPGSSWTFLTLPDDCGGQELLIELTSPYKDYQGLLNTVYVGPRGCESIFLIQTYGPGLITAAGLLILSAALILIHYIFLARNTESRQLLYISLFGLLCSIWILGESHMLQTFTRRLVAWLYITLTALHLSPLPMTFFFEALPDFPYRRICRYTRRAVMLYLLALIVLQYLGIRDFMEMLDLSQLFLIMLCVMYPVLIYYDFFHNKNRKLLPVAAAITVLCASAILELLMSLSRQIVYRGSFLRVGLIVFFLIISVSYLREAIRVYIEGTRSLYYKKLSYTDHMTGCLNRRAYTEREEAWTPGASDILLMADLNNLKLVNDTLGHHAGDEYILACAKTLQEIFQQKGSCYRMGGDEFLFWGTGIGETEMKRLEQNFSDLAHQRCQSISPFCSVATGIAGYLPSDTTIQETLRRADQRMYENKRMKKKLHGRKS